MDHQQKPPNRPSGIPRLASRLPLPTSTASRSLRPSPSRDKLQADPGLNTSRLRRPSEEPVFKKPLPKYTTPSKTNFGLQSRRDVSQTGRSDGGRSETDGLVDNNIAVGDTEFRGRTRPSLSERTIETLAQIPPSPASSRKLSFFNATSPMRSPSRPPSPMSSYSRSPSRSSSSRQQSGSDLLLRTPSCMRPPSRSYPSLSVDGDSVDHNVVMAGDSPPKQTRTFKYEGKVDVTPRASNSRVNSSKFYKGSNDANINHPQQSLHVKKTRSTQTKPPSITKKPSGVGLRSPSTTSQNSELSTEQQSEMESRKASKSSSALRESIAKAKAARKAAVQKSTPQASATNSGINFEDVEDPFNQRPRDSNKGLLKKRVEMARTSGKLNIASMSLKELPAEVITMYDFDPESTTDWYESVDIVRFIAADNEFTELPESAFPDVDPLEVDHDVDDRGNQFGGLELLDLHGNLLRSLPKGFRRLHRLHTLNLSNNELNMDGIRVIMEIESIRELKLAKNQLHGLLPSTIQNLGKLEVLDLHDNSLTDLPESIAELTSLRVLNVGNNQLTSLPFEALANLPLKDIVAPRNKLTGILIPGTLRRLEALQNLDVTSNALVGISEHDIFDFPELQNLSISMNRIKCLPNVSTWQALLTLSAEANALSELPSGFVELKNIRNVDFTGNDISKLDEKIGLMESLSVLRMANNPLRERKFLSMDTENLKRSLRNRCEPESQDTDDEEGSVATQFTLAPETPAQDASWQVKSGGVLDRSYTDMEDLEVEQVKQIENHDVRCLYLHHNELRTFPVLALSALADNLIDLDLSNNPLDSTSLLPSSLTLPNLQSLNLSGAKLTSLDQLLNNLVAPSLTCLDVSFNGLSGSLPPIRQTFPKLATLLAADNKFKTVDYDSVQGLQVLDISNNDISALPPKLGLLRSEGLSKNWGNGSALRRFEVAGNSFRVPRWQIVAKGTDAILEWLKDRMLAEEIREFEPEDDKDSEE